MRTGPLLSAVMAASGCGGEPVGPASGDASPEDTGPVYSCDPEDTGDAAGTDSGDTGEAPDLGSLALDIQAALSEQIVTVVRVTWRTEASAAGYVEFGETEAYGHATPLTGEDTEHEVLLLGMPADTEVHLRVVSADGATASADYTITTGSLPDYVPDFSADGAPESWAGGFLLAPVIGETETLLIVDDRGRVVWYYPLEPEAELARALLARDGGSIIVGVTKYAEGRGNLRRVSLDGAEVVETEIPGLNHDVVELPDGTLSAIVNVANEDYASLGSAILEIAPDGTTAEIWNAWGAFDPEIYNPQGADGGGSWTHANALNYAPEEDAYYISLVAFGTLVKLDRASGQLLWSMFGKANTFSFGEDGEVVRRMHQFQVLSPCRLLIFDNRDEERGSRAVEWWLDEEALYAEEVWDYIPDPPIYVYAKGDVHRYGDGVTQITWSAEARIQDVRSDGTLLWDLDAEPGYEMTFIQQLDGLYGLE